ncbi:MAG TPA: ABC transporter permease [Terriglobia bacterium]|nr:ABC transporter permease [Terriglobia bacterium]
MDSLNTLRVALRELERHKLRSFLTMLGIVVGIAAVVASVSFGEGANNMVQAQISNMGTNLLYAFAGSVGRGGIRQGWGSTSSLTVDDTRAIARDCSAVKLVSAGVEVGAQIVYGGQNWFTQVNGVEPSFATIRNWPMAAGAFFSDEDVKRSANVALMGQTVVDMLFGAEDPLGKTIRVKNIPFRVIGVLAPKGQAAFGFDQDDRIEVPYTTAQKKLVGNTYLQFIAISALDRDAVALAEQQVDQILRERHRLRPDEDADFNVRAMTEAADAAAAAGAVMTLLLAGVASISLLVGGIGIMNIMLVSVTERTREIGIRMATGATESDIRGQFIVEAVALSLLGGVLGIVAGVFLSGGVAQLLGWPRFVSPAALATAVLFSAAVGIFFGYYPAGKAARLDPIEALRYE